MESKRLREILLGALAIALIGTVVWRLRSGGDPPDALTSPANSGVAAAQAPRDKSALAEVDLKVLEAKRPEPEDGGRNPFRFKPKPPPPPPPQPPKPKEPVNTGPVEPPPPPRIPLKFIGVADAGREGGVGRLAVLSDGRGVYYGREGETIEGRYQILKIGVESIELAYIDGRGRQTIRLTGQ